MGLVFVALIGMMGILPSAASADMVISPEKIFNDTRYTEEKYYTTDRVLLSATKHLVESRKAPAINTVITEKEIRNMGARNLFDVLNRIPGLSISWNQIKGLINIRGVQTDHGEKVLLMIDGQSINDSTTGSPTFYFGEDLMVENIKRIEIVRGPGSALFGTNAFIGVINVVTKDPEDYEKNLISSSVGSFHTWNHTLLFSHTKTPFKIAAHMNYFDTDGERPMIDVDAASNNPKIHASLAPGRAQGFDEKIDVGLKLKYNDVSAHFRMIDKDKGSFVGLLGALNDDSKISARLVMANMELKKNVTDDVDFSVRVYTDYQRIDNYFEIYPEGFSGYEDKGLIGNPQGKNITFGYDCTANFRYGNHFFTGGAVYEGDLQYDVKNINNFEDILNDPVDVTDTKNYNKIVLRKMQALFVQDVWEMTAYDTLTLGLRFDHYDDFGGTWHPRIGWVHEFKNEMIFKFLYGTAFRAPSYNELYTINNPSVVGNPDLKPETIRSYEAALEIPRLDWCNLSLNYFYNEIDDFIRMNASAGKPYPFENVSRESVIQGLETELTCYLSPSHYMYVNASYQDSEDEEGDALPYVAEWMGHAGYNITFFDMLNTNLQVSWIGERIRNRKADPDNGEKDNRPNPEGATLVDLTLIAKNFYKSLEIKGSVFNVFDADFVVPSTIKEITHDLPLHKRMFLAEVSYRF